MGTWKPENAVRMTCYDNQQWVVDVEIPVETQIEFKYFVSPEDNSMIVVLFSFAFLLDRQRSRRQLEAVDHKAGGQANYSLA
jgi:hypothetical protein